jgi:hypothetical protein
MFIKVRSWWNLRKKKGGCGLMIADQMIFRGKVNFADPRGPQKAVFPPRRAWVKKPG